MNVIKIGNGLYAHEVTPENISEALALNFTPNPIRLRGANTGEGGNPNGGF